MPENVGMVVKLEFEQYKTKTDYRIISILSYGFGKGDSESFAGLECNQSFAKGDELQMLLRPQLQLALNE